MAKDTHEDISVVHEYLPRITELIQSLVQNENRAIVMACQVFQEYGEVNRKNPFTSAANRLSWLTTRAREMAIRHLKYERNENIKDQAIRAAIHDCA